MSDLLFPTLRGLSYPIQKIPHWKTLQTQSVSGVKKFVSLYTYPYYEFKLTFNYLGDEDSQNDDIHTLAGFYNKMGGAGQDFLFADPLFENNTVTMQEFYVKGQSSDWSSPHLMRSYGGFMEPVFGIIEAPVVYYQEAGSSTPIELTPDYDYFYDSTGSIYVVDGLQDGDKLLWSGKWYYRCHFAEDVAELEQIFYGGWALEELTLESVKAG